METNNKLREACANIAEYARSAMSHTEDAHVLGYLNQIEGWAKAALSAPPRNCDVGTAEEQYKRFIDMCVFRSCTLCPYKAYEGCGRDRCLSNWAQMPYEEGGAK